MKKLFIRVLSLAFALCCLCFALAGCRNPQSGDNKTDGEYSTPPATEQETEQIMYIKIGSNTLTATLADNSSAQALKELLANGPITINMHDYSNFEKVGSLGASLPQNNEYITTEAGDLILYQGNSFVIYYDTNSYSLTRLGKIDGVTQSELMQILGDGDVTVVLSLTK